MTLSRRDRLLTTWAAPHLKARSQGIPDASTLQIHELIR